MSNTPGEVGVQESGEPREAKLQGIPSANTVAVVGDPGTGKTTMLLSFFRFARECRLGTGMAVQIGGCPQPEANSEDGERMQEDPTGEARERLDQLMQATIQVRSDAPNETPLSAEPLGPALRCYISLENSFSRMLQTHSRMLHLRPLSGEMTGRDAESSGDLFVFVDATSLLSGRLEDELRYPGLSFARDGASASSHRLASSWRRKQLTLGGYGDESSDSFGLYYRKPDDASPRRLEQMGLPDASPLACGTSRGDRAQEHQAGPDALVVDLMTRPVREPSRRVRLLKDLLAHLFHANRAHQHRVVCIDSLSALISREAGPTDAQERLGPNRVNMLNLVRWLEENGVTTIMACEAVRTEDSTLRGQPLFLGTEERYLASGVIQLEFHKFRSGDLVRFLRILKMRGCAHDMRRHAYDLCEDGIKWIEPLFGETGGEM